MLTPLIVAIHVAILAAAYSAPFWLDWRLCLILAVIFVLQLLIFGGCLLTMLQFDNKRSELSFQEWLLHQMRLKPSRHQLKLFLRYGPVMVIGWAIIWQEVLHFTPAVRL